MPLSTKNAQRAARRVPVDRPLVSISHLTYAYDKKSQPALDAVALEISVGRITGLVGPDGAGKTTLLRLVAGLLKPVDGRIEACGCDPVRQPDALHDLIGYMPQKFGLYEDLTVMENLGLFADLRGVTGESRSKAFERLLEFTDLKPFTTRRAGRLSGGMKQKLGLACALIKKPRLLLLDEPSVGVDPVSRRELWSMVRELVDESLAVVWSTAYLDEAEKCDRVLLLNGGRLLYSGPPDQLTSQVEGRVMLVKGVPAKQRRGVLKKALDHEDIIDGVVQGSMLRLLRKEAAGTPPPEELGIDAAGGTAGIEPTAPRFEDAFMSILGGGPGGHSQLAERIEALGGDDAPVVVAEGLTKRFGSFTAVQDNSFEIRRGEIYGLLGPNGAGKSTTFKMLCGLLQPSEGSGTVAGVNIRRSASRARARLGYMAQKFSLYGDLTVGQNLDFFSGTYGLSGRDRRQAVDLMIEVFDLNQFGDTPAKKLPLGFKQRLSLACAVMHRPEVLFLDEPTSGVDPVTRREFWTHINGLVEKGGTVLVTTHFMDEAEYCDRIGLIYRGRKIAEGTPDELKRRALSEQTPDPSLEDAFIQIVQQKYLEKEEAA